MSTIIGILLGALAAGGIILIFLAYQPPRDRSTAPRATRAPRQLTLTKADRARLAAGVVVGILIAALTGWVIAIAALPAAAVLLPRLMASGGANSDRIDRLAALEEWTRALNGMLGATAGLSEALTATLRSCPDAIRPEVERLVTRLQVGRPADDALRVFAEDLDDPVGDLIASTLILGATQSGAGLRAILGSLATEVAKEVTIRRGIEAERAGPAREVKILTILVGIGMTAFIGFTTFGQVYSTPAGQAILAVLLAGFFGCLVWLKRLSLGTPEPRFLGQAQRKATLW